MTVVVLVLAAVALLAWADSRRFERRHFERELARLRHPTGRR